MNAPSSDVVLDTEYTQYPTCPHCGFVHEDATPRPGIEVRTWCDSCSEPFLVTCEVEVTWSTSKR